MNYTELYFELGSIQNISIDISAVSYCLKFATCKANLKTLKN